MQLAISALLGALAGGATSLMAATRIARGGELGREQEAARQRMVATTRLFRSRVEVAGTRTGFQSSMDPDYIRGDSGLVFGEKLERDLVHAPAKLAKEVREHLRRLIGPLDAYTARIAAPMPAEERKGDWRALMYLHAAKAVGEGQAENRGAWGEAGAATQPAQHVQPILDELDALEATLHRYRIGLRGRR